MVSLGSLSYSKSPHVARILLSIRADVIMLSFGWSLLIPLFAALLKKALGIVQRAPITIRMTVTFMFHSFSVLLQDLGTYLSSRFSSVLPCVQPERQSPLFGMFIFFLFSITWSGLLAEIRWSVCILKAGRILYISFSRTDFGLCIFHLFVWSNSNFWHNS